MSIEKGLIIPPVKKSKTPNWVVSNNKNRKAFVFDIVLYFFSIKYEAKFKKIESNTINKVSNKSMFISRTYLTKKSAVIWPNIAIHLILIKFTNKIVFIKN